MPNTTVIVAAQNPYVQVNPLSTYCLQKCAVFSTTNFTSDLIQFNLTINSGKVSDFQEVLSFLHGSSASLLASSQNGKNIIAATGWNGVATVGATALAPVTYSAMLANIKVTGSSLTLSAKTSLPGPALEIFYLNGGNCMLFFLDIYFILTWFTLDNDLVVVLGTNISFTGVMGSELILQTFNADSLQLQHSIALPPTNFTYSAIAAANGFILVAGQSQVIIYILFLHQY